MADLRDFAHQDLTFIAKAIFQSVTIQVVPECLPDKDAYSFLVRRRYDYSNFSLEGMEEGIDALAKSSILRQAERERHRDMLRGSDTVPSDLVDPDETDSPHPIMGGGDDDLCNRS